MIEEKKNETAYKFIMLICMLYVSIMICNAVLTNRYVGYNQLFILGGTLTSPFIFIFSDIVTEIYGYKIAKFMIISGFIAQSCFVLICSLIVLHTPFPDFFSQQKEFSSILGSSLSHINGSGIIAFMVANILNVRILSKWKVLLKGKHFWLRSLGSSSFSEALYSLFAIFMMQMNSLAFSKIWKIVILSFGIKIIYNLIFLYPSNVLVSHIKNKTGVDVYDVDANFSPEFHLGKKTC